MDSISVASDGGSMAIEFFDATGLKYSVSLDRAINSKKKNYFYIEPGVYLNLDEEIKLMNSLESFSLNHTFSEGQDVFKSIIDEFIKIIKERKS